MYLDKTVLLSRINSAITRSSEETSHQQPSVNASSKSVEDNSNSFEAGRFSYAHDRKTLRKMEERISALEDEIDHLLFFIHFLYENSPGHGRKMPYPDGRIEYPDSSQAKNIQRDTTTPNYPALTRREVEILHLLVKGFCAKEIARELFICETTVITHKKNLKEKFSAKNTVELISKAFHLVVDSGDPLF